MDEIQRKLNLLIDEVLGGPSTDSDFHHLTAAAIVFQVLDELGLAVDDREHTIEILSSDNGYDKNFLETKY